MNRTAPHATPILELRGVSKTYGRGETAVRALAAADLQLHLGEVVLIQGPSGSGKTTLLSILGLLLTPSEGEVHVGGREVSRLPERDRAKVRAERFGFIFQGFNLFPALTALENVALGMTMKKAKVADPTAEAKRLLEAVGLGARMAHHPADLSGGQKQRVAIARALGGDPPVILGDEPTAALDSKTALGVMDLLSALAREQGRAVVVVTHDHRLERYADRVIRVDDGAVSEDSSRPEPRRLDAAPHLAAVNA